MSEGPQIPSSLSSTLASFAALCRTGNATRQRPKEDCAEGLLFRTRSQTQQLFWSRGGGTTQKEEFCHSGESGTQSRHGPHPAGSWRNAVWLVWWGLPGREPSCPSRSKSLFRIQEPDPDSQDPANRGVEVPTILHWAAPFRHHAGNQCWLFLC